jgi:UDP-N-acetylglucosamine--N-acetylmuramyl-(pentapeptide) pyrophosphoryl-undecaprenol N-acetylglucosamine transferase
MRVIITAGGTGGHIYPALAIAGKIKELEPKSEILYIGTHNRMEKDIVPQNGYQYEAIKIYGFSKKLIKRDLENISLIIKAEKKCLELIKEFKPDVVVGVGGYVTYPVIKAAKKLGIKTFIHEQNSIPGKSNRLLARYADVIGVSFKDTMNYFNKNKCLFTGNPCSERAIDVKEISKTKYGLHLNKKAILMVQGSLGSNIMNKKMIAFLNSIDNEQYEVLYITGKDYYDDFAKNKFSKNVFIVPYVDNLSALIKNMDIIVTRAGASITSEIMALGKPSIFIPSPYVANNHQFYNAQSVETANAGIMILEQDLTEDILKTKINYLLSNPKVYNEMKNNLQKMSINNSSTLIYNILKDLINKK